MSDLNKKIKIKKPKISLVSQIFLRRIWEIKLQRKEIWD